MSPPDVIEADEEERARMRRVISMALHSAIDAACYVLGDRTLAVEQIAAMVLIERLAERDAAAARLWCEGARDFIGAHGQEREAAIAKRRAAFFALAEAEERKSQGAAYEKA